MNYYLLIIIFIGFGVMGVSAQSYTKDSLQIKVYTEIEYKDNKSGKISLKKVFCDYCTPLQLESIGEEALVRAYNERYYPENRLKNGKKKLAIYIRIAKQDFAAIKE